jgi:hypothetical protein
MAMVEYMKPAKKAQKMEYVVSPSMMQSIAYEAQRMPAAQKAIYEMPMAQRAIYEEEPIQYTSLYDKAADVVGSIGKMLRFGARGRKKMTAAARTKLMRKAAANRRMAEQMYLQRASIAQGFYARPTRRNRRGH